jgi:surface polysaccharide O-acyltransferase-like enzyme
MDAFRALAMFVVVAWHWVFTIPLWRSDGPHVDNPLSDLPALAYLTWVLQVMPLFFLVGGYLTARSTRHLTTFAERRRWLGRRAQRLIGPAVPLLIALVTLYGAARIAGQPAVARAIFLTATPLWFLVSYLAVTALVPLIAPAARRWPVGHVVALVGWCLAWDAARFHGLIAGPVLWLSMVVVWLAAHQMGTLLDRLSDRRAARAVLATSLLALAVATHVGPYPVSMVGTRADAISNMGPATAVILALAGVQLALVALLRPWVGRVAVRHQERLESVARHAMPVYVWHMVGFSVCVLATVALGVPLPEDPTLGWWLARPLWVVGPALVAWPLIRRAARPVAAQPACAPRGPAPAAGALAAGGAAPASRCASG